MDASPEIRCWLTGFLAGVLSTLILVDFRLFELWQKGVVLLGLGALIGGTAFLQRRDLNRDRANSWEEGGREPTKPAPATAAPPAIAGQPEPTPRQPEPQKSYQESCSRQIEPSIGKEEPDLGEEGGPENWLLELPLPEPESVLPPFPERLAEVWESYLSRGDGRFTAEGLQRFLDEAGLSGQIFTGEILGAGEGLLAVDLGDGSGRLYLLPDFGKTVRSVAQWFHAPNAGSRLARINRLVEPAVVHHTAAGLELKRHGIVE